MAGWSPYQPPEDGLPPPDVRLTEVRVEPWPEDSRRVRIHLELTPFLERPNIKTIIHDSHGQEVSSIDIIESIDIRMTFTMHIRSQELDSRYTVQASLIYPDIGTVDTKTFTFETNTNTE